MRQTCILRSDCRLFYLAFGSFTTSPSHSLLLSFGAIKEEKEEDRSESEHHHHHQHHHQHQQSPDRPQPPAAGAPSAERDDGSEQLEEEPADGDQELRAHMEEAVSDELATLRSEQEQLANDLKTLLSRQRDAVLQQTTTVG